MAFYDREVGLNYDGVMNPDIVNPFYRLYKLEGVTIGRVIKYLHGPVESNRERIPLTSNKIYIYWILEGSVHKFTSSGDFIEIVGSGTVLSAQLNDTIFEGAVGESSEGYPTIQFVDAYKLAGVSMMTKSFTEREALFFTDVAQFLPFDSVQPEEPVQFYYTPKKGSGFDSDSLIIHIESIQTKKVKVVKEGDNDHYTVDGKERLAVLSIAEASKLHDLFFNQPIGSFIYVRCIWNDAIGRWHLDE